MNFRWLL